MDLNTFCSLLKNNGIPTELYSKGRAKSLEQLHNEILIGESNLTFNENNELIREVNTLSLVVRRPDNKILKEKWQQHYGKEQVSRCYLLAEKIMNNELNDINTAIKRALDEELGSLNIDLNVFIESDTMEKHISESFVEAFPGLKTKYIVHTIQVKIDNLPESDFVTVEYKKENPTEIRLTTAWEWVDPIAENFKTASTKEYLNKYFK